MGPDLSEAGAGAIVVLMLGLVALGSFEPLRLDGPEASLEPERPSRVANAIAVSELDLNASDTKMLATLPGIGPVIAERIVEHRRKHGAFVRVEDLLAVRGIGPAKLAKIEPRVRLGTRQRSRPPQKRSKR